MHILIFTYTANCAVVRILLTREPLLHSSNDEIQIKNIYSSGLKLSILVLSFWSSSTTIYNGKKFFSHSCKHNI